jgi:pimeloyl-ACP methyl ester carboxylesterase
MPFYEKGDVRIHYEEAGSGFPVLFIPGGGLNSNISYLTGFGPFNCMEEFKDEYRCITMDLRNADGGQSSGPLEIDRPWDAYADDQLGLMDHLGIQEFMVMGFCIGGPFIWNLLKRAPERIVAAVLAQPSGSRPEMPDLFYQNNIKGWGPALCARQPNITMAMVEAFLNKMYRSVRFWWRVALRAGPRRDRRARRAVSGAWCHPRQSGRRAPQSPARPSGMQIGSRQWRCAAVRTARHGAHSRCHDPLRTTPSGIVRSGLPAGTAAQAAVGPEASGPASRRGRAGDCRDLPGRDAGARLPTARRGLGVRIDRRTGGTDGAAQRRHLRPACGAV